MSYYFYRLNQLPIGSTFREFLERRDHFPSLWGEHVRSWLFRRNRPSEILVIRYEDLINDCVKELRRMMEFSNLSLADDQIRCAVEASNFKTMQSLEFKKGIPTRKDNPEVFVRKGREDLKPFEI